MIMPSASVILVAVAVLTIFSILDWLIGGLAYNQRPTHDLPKSTEVVLIKKAAA